MAGLGTALIAVGADTTDFEQDLSRSLENALSKDKFSAIMGVGAAAAVAAVIKEFVPLEKAILQIFQVEGVNATDAMFTALSNQLLDLAGEVGKPAEEVGSAIALGIGRGFSEQESIGLTEVSSNLAVALGEDLEPAMKGVTATLNGFNLGVSEADRVAGVLFETVARSGIPMSQLAQQIGNIAPSARNAGVALEDVAAAVATMVQQGISAAESTTQIRTAITELSREASDGGKVFKSISGSTFPEFIKQGHTLGEALALIQAAADKSGYSVAELTGNYNTQNAVTAVAVNGLQNYNRELAANGKGVEDVSAALDAANQGVMRKWQIALNDVRTGVQRLGVAFRPLIQAITNELTPVVTAIGTKLNEFALWVQTVDFTPLVNMIHTLVGQFSSLVTAVLGVIQGIDWGNVFNTIAIAAAPVIIAFKLVGSAVAAIADIIVWATPALQGFINILVTVAAPVAALMGILGGFAVAAVAIVAGLSAIGGGLLLVAKIVSPMIKTLALLRWAFMAVWASALGPIGAIVIAIGVLSAAIYVAYQSSDTFRKGFITAVNAIKDAVITGVEWMIKAILLIPRAWLETADAILASLEFLPDWMGGGVVDGARAGVQKLLNGLDTITEGITNVANAARNADWEIQNMLSSTEKAAQAAAQAGLWFGNAETDKALEEAMKGPAKPPKIPTPRTGGLDELLNPDKTKNAAKAAADKIKDILAGLFESIQDLAKDISEKSADSIENGFDGIIKKFNSAIATAASMGNATLVKTLRKNLAEIQKYEKTLLKLASKRDIVQDALKNAESALSSLTQESESFRKSTYAAFVNLGSVAEASAGVGVTFRGIRNNLRDAIRTTQLFSTTMKQLESLNLNPQSLKQLADAGPAALDQARALARSGTAGVAEINKLQAELDKLATKNADKLTDEFFKQGVAMAEGLVAGLKSQEAAIMKQMDKVAASMVSTMKKALKIKSPSGVFADEIGTQIPAGAAVGVRRGIPELVKAVEAMAASSANAGTNFGPGSISVNGVADPEAARRAGILAGQGINRVLATRRTAKTLAGL